MELREVRLLKRTGRLLQPVPWGSAPVLLVSEALREVDLLVSVGTYALAEDASLDTATRQRHLASLHLSPATASMRIRRRTLERIFANHPQADQVSFDERHVRIGDFAVHLSTARVTQQGDPVEITLPPQRTAIPLPWLPYDETLLERVAHTVAALLAQERPTSPGPG
jgi:hypothetical protein